MILLKSKRPNLNEKTQEQIKKKKHKKEHSVVVFNNTLMEFIKHSNSVYSPPRLMMDLILF